MDNNDSLNKVSEIISLDMWCKSQIKLADKSQFILILTTILMKLIKCT